MKNIVILTTGGTISMKDDAQAGGAVPALTGADFLATLPADMANVRSEAFCSVPGSQLTLEQFWGVRCRAAELLASDKVDSVIITHGTDTMEETAYLCDITIDSDKPVVLTGSMRTASELGYEGPANFASAVRVAASDVARGMGALLVMNDEIHAARFVTKTHTLNPATFRSPVFGAVGYVDGNFVNIPQRVEREYIPCTELETRVYLIRLCVGMDDGFLRHAVERGAQGVVLEALGGGRVPPWWRDTMIDAIKRGIPIVIASRTGSGRVFDYYGYQGAYRDHLKIGAIPSPGLPGHKARIKLMALLGAKYDMEQIRAAFAPR